MLTRDPLTFSRKTKFVWKSVLNKFVGKYVDRIFVGKIVIIKRQTAKFDFQIGDELMQPSKT